MSCYLPDVQDLKKWIHGTRIFDLTFPRVWLYQKKFHAVPDGEDHVDCEFLSDRVSGRSHPVN